MVRELSIGGDPTGAADLRVAELVRVPELETTISEASQLPLPSFSAVTQH
jgi:hypothetical protein